MQVYLGGALHYHLLRTVIDSQCPYDFYMKICIGFDVAMFIYIAIGKRKHDFQNNSWKVDDLKCYLCIIRRQKNPFLIELCNTLTWVKFIVELIYFIRINKPQADIICKICWCEQCWTSINLFLAIWNDDTVCIHFHIFDPHMAIDTILNFVHHLYIGQCNLCTSTKSLYSVIQSGWICPSSVRVSRLVDRRTLNAQCENLYSREQLNKWEKYL